MVLYFDFGCGFGLWFGGDAYLATAGLRSGSGGWGVVISMTRFYDLGFGGFWFDFYLGSVSF